MTTATKPLNPLMCGKWDGANLWMQWDSAGDAARYVVRLRLRGSASEPWGRWITVGAVTPFERPWAVVQHMRAGWDCQAQVAALADGKVPAADSDAWQAANEVTFERSRAVFRFQNASPREMDLPAGAVFDAMVDLAACSYRLPSPLTVPAQADATAEMESLQTTAWMQVDAAGDFVSRPLRGLTVTNTGPSAGGVSAPTGRGFTRLEADKAGPGGPGRIISTGRSWALPVVQ